MFTRLTLAATLVALTAARAQTTRAELSGFVRDGGGLPVPGARVSAVQPATTLATAAVSARDGSYRFLALPAGSYTLQVSKPGFVLAQLDGVRLGAGDKLALDWLLIPGDPGQTVQVTGEAPLLQAGSGSLRSVVERGKLAAAPLDGRNFVPLIALAPGVSLPPGSLLPRINGSRPRVNEYIYDGISVLQPEPGQVALYPVIDAIEEFRVETNSYSAEYGRSNGGVVLVTQRSGANDVRGTLFEFFRHERLNARNLFAASGEKPRFRRNQFGFVLGGPVRRNRTFFFADWQSTRLDTGVVRTSTVPTPAQQRGQFASPIFDPATTRYTAAAGFERDPFPAALIPPSRVDHAASGVAGRYPAPTSESLANNFSRLANNATVATQFDGRLDRYFGARHRVFGRYSFLRDRSEPAAPLPDGSGSLNSGASGNTLTRADALAAEHTWTISPAAVNQLRAGYTRRHAERFALRDSGAAALVPHLPVTSFAGVLPTFDIVGFQQIGPSAGANSDFSTSVTQLIDNYAWTRGGHSVKAGADLRWESLDVLQPASPTGNFQFTSLFTGALEPGGAVVAGAGDSFASFLLGQVSRFSFDSQPEKLAPRARIAEFFIQNDWRVTQRLSANLGVRYTLNFPSTVQGDRGAVFNLATEQLDFLGRDGFPRTARNLETKNFAPRLGLAFKITESFAARAGYGLTWIEQAGITTPFTTPLFPFIQTLTQQSADNIAPAFILAQGPTVRLRPPGPDSGLGQGVFAVQRDNGSGYAQQWNATLQKTFAANWSIEAGYAGSKLTGLGVPDVNLNQLRVEQLAEGAPVLARQQSLRPYPRFNTVALYRNNTGHSTYHSLQTRAERRFSRGLTFTAAYTFSRLIDDAGAVFDAALLAGPVTNFQAADSYNKRLEKDVSTGSIPHIFSGAIVYQLPFARGWQVATLIRAQAGAPVAVTQATNLNAFAGFGIQRPNRIADPGLDGANRSTGHWFNTAAFQTAPQFTIGNSSRNPVTGPAYRTLDVMLGKTFRLRETVQAEFRAEAFNLTNTPPLANPNGSFGHPAFGTITAALDPRVFELVLKLHFGGGPK